MMDKKGSSIVPTDWRTEITSETRLKVLDFVRAKLNEMWLAHSLQATNLDQVADFAMNLEKKIFYKAKSKEQYINTLTRKMSRTENNFHGSSSSQNRPAFSSNKSIVQTKKEACISQPLPQMTNQTYLRPVPNLHYQQTAVHNSLLQQNIQQLMPQQYEQLHRQKLNSRQTHQQFEMHNQSCVIPQSTLNSPCRPLGLQSRNSGIHMSQEMFTPHPKVVNLQPNENLTVQVKEEVIGEDFQASTFLHQRHTAIAQYQQHQSMGVSAVSNKNLHVEDWHDQAYSELQGFMKYLPFLKKACDTVSKQCLQLERTDQIQNFVNNVDLLHNMIKFLVMPRNKVMCFTKERFYGSMQTIMNYLKYHEKRNINLVNKQQSLHRQPGLSQSHINPVQQRDDVDPNFRPVKNLSTTGSSDSSLRSEANRIQKNLLQKRQHSENTKREFQSPWIQQKQKSLSNQDSEKSVPKDSSASSFGRASPTPSSLTVGLGKNSSNVSCLSSLNFQNPQTHNPVKLPNTKTEIRLQSQEIRSSGTLTSRLAERTSHGSNQQLLTATQPLNRLLKAVESMSNEALRTAVSEIGSVGNMNDTMTEPSLFETRCHQKAAHLSFQDGCCSSNNMKRKISATAFNDMPSPCSDIDGSEPTVTSRSKKLKKLSDNALLGEMRNINQQLVETVLELDLADNLNNRLANAGTVLRCSYSAVTESKNSKFHFANTLKLPVLSVKLLVPLDYPEDYPVLLSRFNTDCGTVDEESRDLSSQATSLFRAYLRTAPECLSLGDYARAWDQCARAVVSDYAQRIGGGCFSSKYGTWEDAPRIAAT